MSVTIPETKGFYARHKLAVETVVLFAILAAPIFLYLAAEAKNETIVGLLFGIMSALMMFTMRLK